MNGQILGQTIVFVIATIVFGLILIYGRNVIDKLIKTKKEVEFINFKNDLTSSIDAQRHSYGSKGILELYPLS